MAAHGARDGGVDRAALPESFPFDLDRLSRLSWELGSRTVEDDEATRHSEWNHVGTSWKLSIIRVTDDTVLLSVRTPVGRERFYGAAQIDLDEALPRLDAAPRWQRVE